MKNKKNKGNHLHSRGFTLVEVLITVAILAVIMGVIGTLFISGMKSYSLSQNNSLLQNDTRLSMEIIQNELRYAKKFFLISADVATNPELQEEGFSYIYLHEGKVTVKEYTGPGKVYSTRVLPGVYAEDRQPFAMKDIVTPGGNLIIEILLDGRLNENSYALSTDLKLVNIDDQAEGDFGKALDAQGRAVKYLK